MNCESGKSYDRRICYYGNSCETDESCYIPKAPEILDVCFDIRVTGLEYSEGTYTELLLYNSDFDVGTPLLNDSHTSTKICKKTKKKDVLIFEYLADDAVSLHFSFPSPMKSLG